MKKGLARFAAFAMLMAVILAGCSKSNIKDIHSAADVNRQSFNLGLTDGTYSALQAEKLFPDASLQYIGTTSDACAAVKAGKVDGYMFDKVVLDEFCRENPDLAIMDETYDGSNLAIGLAKGNKELLQKVNDVLAVLREDGTLDDMARRWIDGEAKVMPVLEAPTNPSGTLRILTEGLIEPFNYITDGGVCIGFDIELGMRIAYALGMDYSVQTMNFDALIPALTAGKGDLLICELNITEERQKEISFSDSYYTSVSAILVKKARYEPTAQTFELTDSEIDARLSESKIGAVSGSLSEQNAFADYPDAQIKTYPTATDALNALSAEKIDYALVTEQQAEAYLEQTTGCRYCTDPVYATPNSFIMARDNTELCEKINAVLARFREDGTLDRVYEKWLSGDYSQGDIPLCEDGEVLSVAVSANLEPLCFVYNNEITGSDCEIVQRIAYELGMRVEFTEMSYSAIIPAIASGKVDVSLACSYSEERAKEVLFSDAYYEERIVLVERTTSSGETTPFLEKLKNSFIGTFLTENRWELFAKGIGVTIEISVLAYILGTVLGMVLCLMLRSSSRIYRGIAMIYSKIITGIPILVWLMVLYYMVFRSVNISGIIVAIIGFGLETGASLAGVFKTGLDSVDDGQVEAAMALGFLPSETFRRIVFPQAAARIFDLYSGAFVSLVKATSIVGYIAIMDLTKVSDIVRSRTYQPFFPLIATALIYFGITRIFVVLLRRVQRKLNPKLRKCVLKGIKT